MNQKSSSGTFLPAPTGLVSANATSRSFEGTLLRFSERHWGCRQQLSRCPVVRHQFSSGGWRRNSSTTPRRKVLLASLKSFRLRLVIFHPVIMRPAADAYFGRRRLYLYGFSRAHALLRGCAEDIW